MKISIDNILPLEAKEKILKRLSELQATEADIYSLEVMRDGKLMYYKAMLDNRFTFSISIK